VSATTKTRFDPRARGREWNDIRWGGRFNASQVIVAVAGGFSPLKLSTPGTLVMFDMWPARLVSIVAMMTPTTLPAWTTDGGTYDGFWTVGIGAGQSRDNLIVPFTFAPPYAQVSTLTASGLPLCVPAKQVTITGQLTGTPSAAATLAVAFSAYVAPFTLGGLGLPEEGGSGG
jgi:hypothetical protein